MINAKDVFTEEILFEEKHIPNNLKIMSSNFFEKKAGLLLIAGACSFPSFAQESAVNGSVRDASGEPLIGVSVQVKNTGLGTITDIDGNFSLPNVKAGQTLIFSYVGYKTTEVEVK